MLNALNREILRCVQERGRSAPSGTELRGRFAIRPCIINPRTSAADVDALLEDIETCGNEIWQQTQQR